MKTFQATAGIRSLSLVLVIATLCVCFVTPAWSQTDRGTIRGTVLDATGAVIPGASVTVTNVGTGVTVETISTDAGTYNVSALPSGVYNIQVQLQGFKTLLRPNVAVSAGNITGLDLTIEVGSIGETLTVVGEAALLRTESSGTGIEVDARAYVDLPLSSGGGRRSSGFLVLVPGYSGNPGGFADAINGGQASTKEQQLEGASMATAEILQYATTKQIIHNIVFTDFGLGRRQGNNRPAATRGAAQLQDLGLVHHPARHDRWRRRGFTTFSSPNGSSSSAADRGEFLEWAQVHGNMYGTPRKIVENLLAEGSDVILEIDVQGAAEVKSAMPEARLIFIEAPSMQILEQRLRKRSTEREDVQARRISDAYDELRKKGSFDGVVVNVEVEQAVKEVLALMDSR